MTINRDQNTRIYYETIFLRRKHCTHTHSGVDKIFFRGGYKKFEIYKNIQFIEYG